MYKDYYFTSYFLAHGLAKLKCSLTETIPTKRENLLIEIKSQNFRQNPRLCIDRATIQFEDGKTRGSSIV